MNPKFTISILGLDNLALSKRCVESVRVGGGDWEIIFTDNGSRDGTPAWLVDLKKNLGDKLTVIRNAKNEGFIDPNNHALTLARGQYFVCLNNDVVVPVGWLDALAAPFADFPKAALSGPANSCSQLDPNFHGQMGGFEYLEGSCLCCKTEIVREHGLFSAYLTGAYGEDSDLSLRLRQRGYTLHRVHLRISHARAATSSRVPMARVWQENNHLVLREKWGHYLRVRKFDYPIIVKRDGAWGDVLMTTPVVRALRAANPTAKIWIETQCADVYRDNPYIDRVERVIHQTPDARVIDLNMAYEMKAETHVVDAYAWKADIQAYEKRCDFFINESEVDWARGKLGEGEWVAFHAGPLSWLNKEWGNKKFSHLATLLKNSGYKIVLLGNARNGDITCDLDLRGQTSVHQMGAVCKQVSAFVGVDSFPMHVAMAMWTPTVGIFGVTSPEYLMSENAPHIGVKSDHPSAGLRHRTVGKTFVEDRGEAIATITVEQVFEAFQKLTAQCPA